MPPKPGIAARGPSPARRARAGLLAGLLIGWALGVAPGAAQAGEFRVWSPTLRDGVPAQQRYDGPGCGGSNVSPRIDWSGLPPGTRSLALTVFDRDARKGAGWWHWAVADIPASAPGLEPGAGAAGGAALPAGARQLRSSFGKQAYGGPCHYEFTLWALPMARLDLPPDADAAQLAERASAQALGVARMQAVYGR
jgi:Raf kinase inhibitor-like YbhB/YbcL family protein